MSKSVVITSATRTAVGSLGKSLKNIPGEELGSVKNLYQKPAAGITSVNSKSEGSVGALRRTTVEFIVHNKEEFDTIFLPFFLMAL